jgi:hypothetical protein
VISPVLDPYPRRQCELRKQPSNNLTWVASWPSAWRQGLHRWLRLTSRALSGPSVWRQSDDRQTVRDTEPHQLFDRSKHPSNRLYYEKLWDHDDPGNAVIMERHYQQLLQDEAVGTD